MGKRSFPGGCLRRAQGEPAGWGHRNCGADSPPRRAESSASTLLLTGHGVKKEAVKFDSSMCERRPAAANGARQLPDGVVSPARPLLLDEKNSPSFSEEQRTCRTDDP